MILPSSSGLYPVNAKAILRSSSATMLVYHVRCSEHLLGSQIKFSMATHDILTTHQQAAFLKMDTPQ